MKKILVTGGAGFVGANLIEELLKLNYEVISIDDYSIGTEDNHVDGAKYYKININDINTFSHKVDYCFHLAGLSRIQPSFQNPSNTFNVNTLGTQNIIEWCRVNQVKKVIYAGSSSKHHNPVNSPYAMYKFLGEEICKLYRKTYEIDIEIARFYNVYGPKEILDGEWAAVIGLWRNFIKNKKPIPIVGDGNQRRDFTHVKDITSGLISILKTDKKNTDAWEIGSGKNYSINEVFLMFKDKYPNIEKTFLNDQKGNYRETLRENNDMLDLLAWGPKYNLKDYISSLK